eukprot:Opistho-1_new@57093
MNRGHTPQLGLDLLQEELLRADDRPRPTYPNPRDRLRGREAEILDHVARDQCARATETRLAVHCNHAVRALGDLEEALHNLVARRAAVEKVQVVVLEPRRRKPPPIVHLLIEAHDRGDALCAEVRHVVLRCERRVPVLARIRAVRTAKRDELPGNDPVQVAVLHALKVLVFFEVEGGEVEETAPNGLVHAAQAVQKRQVVRRRPVRRVAERLKRRIDADERLVGLLRGALETDDGEASHEARGVGALRGVKARVVVDDLVLQRRHLELLLQQNAVSIEHRQVERAKVSIEAFVNELIVNAKVMRARRRLRLAAHRHEIEPIFHNFASVLLRARHGIRRARSLAHVHVCRYPSGRALAAPRTNNHTEAQANHVGEPRQPQITHTRSESTRQIDGNDTLRPCVR